MKSKNGAVLKVSRTENVEYVLAKFKDGWADECDFVGFKIFTLSEWKAFKSDLQKHFNENSYIEIYFGTNESNTYDSAKELLNTISILKITTSEKEMIQKIFAKELYKSVQYGTFPYIPDEDEH